MCRAPFAENKKHGLGWVLAVQDDDMARAGASMLEKIWGLVESHPIITGIEASTTVMSMS